ncbi:MFS transporter [Goodfellowiella coeruleoviolacea]|uniref:Arabinose efflux permease, MFS family n=1 Tax=Goodfellowiella coeruleoviolacea TaxID=334858 RepID=A0AAE3KIB4_9PSEU|nr:MFS transporter [Goodfellowiella coeruleoviolacea]MCP2167797.1 putative arabinose efflux permease, MFS family [Goodfellowiella coeruleoviolacea]
MSDTSRDAAEVAPRLAVPRVLLRYAELYLLLFLFGAEMYLVAPLLPVIAPDLGVPVTAVASLVTVYVLVQAIAGPIQGLAYARTGARVMVVGGTLVFAVGNAVAAISSDFTVLAVVRGVAGLGVAMSGPAIWSWIAATAPEHARGTAVGGGMGSFAIGQVLGVPIGAFIASAANWHWSFGALAVASALTLPLLWWSLRTARPTAAGARTGVRGEVRTLLRSWTHAPVRTTLLITFLFHAANLGAYTFLSDILANRHHLPGYALGFVGLLSGLGMFVGSLLGGRVADRLRGTGRTEAVLLPIWLGVLIVTFVGAVCASGLWVSLVLIPVWFVAAGAFDTNQQTLIAGQSPGFTAVALSWNLSVLYAAAAFGVWVMSFGADRVLAVTAAGTVLAALALAGAVATARRRSPAGGAADA